MKQFAMFQLLLERTDRLDVGRALMLVIQFSWEINVSKGTFPNLQSSEAVSDSSQLLQNLATIDCKVQVQDNCQYNKLYYVHDLATKHITQLWED